MERLFAAAVLIVASEFATAACPTTVQTYMGSTSGEVFPNYVMKYHETFILQNPPGSVYNVVPTPRFSISQPLSSAADLNRLTHDDWLKIVEYGEKSKAASLADRPSTSTSTREHEISHKKANLLNAQGFDALISCYVAQTAKSHVDKKTAAQLGSISQKEKSDNKEMTHAEIEERMVDTNDQMRSLVASRSAKEDADKYESATSFVRRQESGGARTDKYRAKILSPKCIQFKDFGSGVTSDVEKVLSSCTVPVAVTYCFHREAPDNGCNNKAVGWGTTGVIRPGGSRVVINPGKGDKWRVDYYVCDMSDPDKLCLKP